MNIAIASHIANIYNKHGKKQAVAIFGEDSVEDIENLYSWLLK